MDDQPNVITLPQAAEMLQQPLATVKQMAKAGLFPTYGQGRSVRTFRTAIQELLQQLESGEKTWHGNGDRWRAARQAQSRVAPRRNDQRPREGTTPGVVKLVARPPRRTTKTSP